MPDEHPEMPHFLPEKAREQIPLLFPSCTEIQERDAGWTLVMVLGKPVPLSERELGRLLVIHGKCKNQGIRIMLRCSEPAAEQLSRLLIDRLIFLERING
ncbi:MAG TPA: hypothetical protein PK360_13355 [bacterium]|nr:hypothetical protein [bacterium]